MMNPITPDQIMSNMKQAQAAMVEMAARTIELMEKHVDLSLQAAKSNLADATEAASQLMSVKDASEFYSTAQSVGQPLVGKMTQYSRDVYSINAETAAEFGKMVEARIEEANKTMAASIQEASKNAPAGSEGVIAMMKSGFSAANSAFDAMNKATKQVVEMVESNVEAATKASEAAVANATPKAPARRKPVAVAAE